MRIELRGVRKQFGGVDALRGVDLVVPHGTRVGLIGPNGSGKSTMLRIVMGLLSCEGEVLLDGQSPFTNRVEVARRLGYVPQTAPQLGALVGEVVAAVTMLRSLERTTIDKVSRRMGLPLGDILRRPFRALSGGMKQKLLIAVAFSAGADLLVLDEPTASLDARARDAVWNLLDEAAASATVILCSHRLDEIVRRVERVIAMAEGTIVYDGPASEALDERDFGRPVAAAPEGQRDAFSAASARRFAASTLLAERAHRG